MDPEAWERYMRWIAEDTGEPGSPKLIDLSTKRHWGRPEFLIRKLDTEEVIQRLEHDQGLISVDKGGEGARNSCP